MADVGRSLGVADVGRREGVAVSVGSEVEGAAELGDLDAVGVRVTEAEGEGDEECPPLRLADGVPRSAAVGLGE